MKKFLVSMGLSAAMTLLPVAVFAGAQDFTLVNKTGDTIDQIYISPTKVADWEEDVLNQDVLEDGERVEIAFASRGANSDVCSWDIQVVYTDGEGVVWEEVDLCELHRIVLHWDEDTQRTWATAD